MSVSVAKAYGPLIIGSLLASFLSGMNSLQAIVYLRVYPDDSKLLKTWVLSVWALDIFHTGCICAILWIYLIQDFGDIFKTNTVLPAFIGVTICAVFLDVLVYGFHALRIFHLSNGNRRLTVSIVVIGIIRAAGFIAYTGVLVHLGKFSKFSNRYSWLLSATVCIEVLDDILVVLFKYILLRKYCRDSLRKLHNFIDEAVLYTLEINSLTAFSVIICMALWFGFKDPLLFLCIYFPIPKLHANSFMGSLITRYHLRRVNKPETMDEAWNVATPNTIGTIGLMTDGLTKNREDESLSPNTIRLRRLHVDGSAGANQHNKSESLLDANGSSPSTC